MAIQATTQTTGWAVNDAIRTASRATGASFDYLLATAKVESDFNPTAAASTSSARGLFQFIDQTWLAMVKEAGPRLGLGRYADAIVATPSGRYDVPDPTARRAIMALRDDPTANAAMAGAFTQRNAARLAGKLGRAASEGELYIAHFLGPAGAARLITLARDNPNAVAADAFPKAAAANRSIFYDRQGHARTVAQVYGVLVGRYDVARAGAGVTVAAARAPAAQAETPPMAARFDPALFQPSTYVPPASVQTAPVFHGLFRSEANRGAVSQFIRDLWTARPHVAAALSAQTAQAIAPVSPGAASAGVRSRPLGLFSDRS